MIEDSIPIQRWSIIKLERARMSESELRQIDIFNFVDPKTSRISYYGTMEFDGIKLFRGEGDANP